MFRSNLFKLISCNSTRSLKNLIVHEPPPTYGDPKMPDKLYKTIEFEMRGAEPAVLASYTKFLLMAAGNLKIEVGRSWKTKPAKERWSLLKSAHVYRKHLVQYEVRTYYRWVQFHKLTGSTADTFIEYVERMLPEGVALKVTKVSIEELPSHLNKKIALGESINVEEERTEEENVEKGEENNTKEPAQA